MKKLFYVILAVSVLGVTSCSNSQKKKSQDPNALEGEISLSGAFALYPMVVKWAEEFQKLHPDVKIDISGGGAGKGMTDALSQVVDLGMVSREIHDEEFKKGALGFAVVKDAVVPTINVSNPDLSDIKKKGITRDMAAKLWNGECDTWGKVLGSASTNAVHVYTRSDACGAAETWALWFGKRQEDLKGTAVFGDPGVASAVQKDKIAIGFNNIAYAYDQKTQKPYDGLAIAPLDINENGIIDPEEDFYETTQTLMDAIASGKYPSPPARDLYLVSKGVPQKPEVVEFIKYILGEGQKYASSTGYISLSPETRNAGLAKLIKQ